jgi:hypothetical protein
MKNPEVLDRAEISGTNVIVEYSKTEAALADLRAKYSGVVFDLTTTKGDKEARAARLELVTLRTSLEKKRKEFKAPALAFGKKIDSEAERVTAEIVKLESFIDQQIKADEDRRAAEKAERDRIEAERVKAIQDKITAIRGFVAKCQDISAERIANGIELVSKVDTGAHVFFEFADQAQAAKDETVKAMRDMLEAAKAREAEAARVDAQRLENERIAEQNRIQAEAMAKQQAELDKAAAAIKAEQDRLAEERQKAEAAAKIKADAEIAEQLEARRQAAAAIESAKQPEPARAQVEGNDILMLAGELVAVPTAKPETPPTLKLGVICTRLSNGNPGLQVTADFLRGLGFEPAGRDRAAVLYHEEDFQAIGRALIEHIESVLEGVVV